MGNNRFMVVSEEKDIIAMNPSYIEQFGTAQSELPPQNDDLPF